MTTVALFVSLLIAWWSFAQKRKYPSETLSAKFLSHVREGSVSLFLVLLFYHALAFLLGSGWQGLTVAQLIELEEWINTAKQLSDKYKPTWFMSLLVLLSLYFFSRIWIRFFDKATPFHAFKKVAAVLTLVNNILFLLAAFTLLGSESGRAAATLEVHIRQEREAYGLLKSEIAEALAAPIANGLYQRVVASVPRAGEIPGVVNRTLEEGERLRRAYSDASAAYKSRNERVSLLVKRTQDEEHYLHMSASTRGVNEPKAGKEDTSVPDDITFRDIQKARAEVKAYKATDGSRALHLIEQPGGKEIILALPDGPLDRIFDEFDPLTEHMPLLKPLVDILKAVASDNLEKALDRAIEKLTRSVAKEPSSITTALPRAAQEIAESPLVPVRPDTIKDLSRRIDSANQHVLELRAATGKAQQSGRAAQLRASRHSDNTPRPSDIAARSRPVEEPRRRWRDTPDDPPQGGGFGGGAGERGEPGGGFTSYGSSRVTSCVCNVYVNGALVRSYPIPPGASCGGQVCR